MHWKIDISIDGDELALVRFRPAIGVIVMSGIVASLEAVIAVEPTGVEPTGVEPTGVEPTGVEPTGAEPSWPATSICRTVVSPVAPRQVPPAFGMRPSGAHHAA